jgi:outer membrane protein assembly factor BamB
VFAKPSTGAIPEYAFHRSDGSLAWKTQVGQYVLNSSPALGNGVVNIAAGDSGGGHLRALDAATGQILFTTSTVTGDAAANSPVVVNGMVFIGARAPRSTHLARTPALNATSARTRFGEVAS